MVDEIEVHIFEAEIREGFFEGILDTTVIGGPSGFGLLELLPREKRAGNFSQFGSDEIF